MNYLNIEVLSSIAMLAAFGFLLWRINKLIFKSAKMKLNTLKKTSLEMVVYPDPARLAREICHNVFTTFKSLFAQIYLVDKTGHHYELQYLTGHSETTKKRIGKRDVFVRWFTDIAPSLHKENLLPKSQTNVLSYRDFKAEGPMQIAVLNKGSRVASLVSRLKRELESLKAELVVASFYKRKLYGLLILGKKKSGFYTPEDLDILSSLSRIAAMNIRNALTIEQLHNKVRDKTKIIQEMRDRTIQMVLSFNRALDTRDAYTGDHSIEVSEIGGWIAQEMGIEMTEDLSFGLQLHDIGKIGIKDSVLHKPGKLTDEEFEIIKTHPKVGYDILSIMAFFKNIANIVYSHQERYDGYGYPRKLKGTEIPLEARIIGVADAYHAMTSDRPYRDKIPMPEVARQLLRGRGKQFDPEVVDALLRKLIKVRAISQKTISYLLSEEGLVPFTKIDAFIDILLKTPKKRKAEEPAQIPPEKQVRWELVSLMK